MAKYTKREQAFFADYAKTILELVSRPQVRGLLERLVSVEGIVSRELIDLRVMMFPAMPLNGRLRSTLHGSYNHEDAQISLYPLKLPRVWIRKTGFELFKVPLSDLNIESKKLLREIQVSCLSTLVHEVLHVKFGDSGMSRYVEESIVRKLERKYMIEWQSELEGLLVS